MPFLYAQETDEITQRVKTRTKQSSLGSSSLGRSPRGREIGPAGADLLQARLLGSILGIIKACAEFFPAYVLPRMGHTSSAHPSRPWVLVCGGGGGGSGGMMELTQWTEVDGYV